MIINHNISALNAHRQLGANQGAVQGSLEKLSSGLRINKAGDDAAGLAISEKMRGQIRGLEMAEKNAQDGISLIQTAEGALNETHSILQRMRELAVQSSNDTNTDADRAELQKEVDQLAQEITRIAEDTEFNTQNLLGGEFDATFHIGANEGQNISVSINAMDSQTLKVSENQTGLELNDAGTHDGVTASVLQDADSNVVAVQVDDKWYAVDDVQSDGATPTASLVVAEGAKELNVTPELADGGTTEYTINKGVSENQTGLELNDAGTHDGVTASVLQDADSNVVAVQVDDKWYAVDDVQSDGATPTASLVVAEEAKELNVTSELADGGTTEYTINKGVNISDQTSADAAITTINAAIETVSAERSKLGAVQNRLDHTINNLGTSAENLTAAESRIRDVDMAAEMMEFTKNNILSQAAQSMLAQANQQPQGVLQLLQ